MNLFGFLNKKQCEACKRMRWYMLVKKRVYHIEEMSNLQVTSNGELCNKCFNAIKSFAKGVK